MIQDRSQEPDIQQSGERKQLQLEPCDGKRDKQGGRKSEIIHLRRDRGGDPFRVEEGPQLAAWAGRSWLKVNLVQVKSVSARRAVHSGFGRRRTRCSLSPIGPAS